MDNPRPDKVAVVEEVRRCFKDSAAALLTEYRGLKVGELANLRRSLAPLGGDYKVYKNTLVRLATADTSLAGLHDLLVGPTAIAFVRGDAAAVAKALRDYSRTNPHLVVKGGVLSGSIIGVREAAALADLPPRDQVLAQMAAALAAPLRALANLLQANPRDLGYGLAALRDKLAASQPPPAGAAPEPPAGAAPEPPAGAAPEPPAGEAGTTDTVHETNQE
jgi:large subunit ribosomal protein L10